MSKLAIPSAPSPSPPSTPPRHHTELPTIPLAVRSLKRQADQLWYSDVNSPTYKQKFRTFVLRSLAQAQDGVQAKGDYENIQTAERE